MEGLDQGSVERVIKSQNEKRTYDEDEDDGGWLYNGDELGWVGNGSGMGWNGIENRMELDHRLVFMHLGSAIQALVMVG